MFNDLSLEIKLGLIGAVLAGLIGGYVYWHHKVYQDGYNAANSKWNIEIDKSNQAADDKLQSMNNAVESLQKSLDDSQNQIIAKNKELDHAKQDYETIHAKYLFGISRMSIRANCPKQISSNNEASHGTIANGTDSTTVELMPSLSASILDFARGYRENLRLKNECVQLYQNAIEKINK